MKKQTLASFALSISVLALGMSNVYGGSPQISKQKFDSKSLAGGLTPISKCVVAESSGSTNCKDAGGFDSTCATATCPAGYTLTGGGGACAAGDRKIKSLFPRFDKGEFNIACEQQGVDPQVEAICCKF